MSSFLRKLLAVIFACSGLMNSAFAATCDIANPVLPCDLGGTTYDTFAGNYSGNRSFYRASSYDKDITGGYLCLSIKSGLPHSDGYAYVAGYGTQVWTSPPPYNVSFGIFGQFGGSCIEQANNFVWIGVGSPNPPSASPPLPIGGGWVLTSLEYSNFASRQYFDSKAYKGLNHVGDDLALSADGSRTASSTTSGKQVHPICSGFVERIEARRAVEESYMVVRHPSCVGKALVAYYGHLQPCERTNVNCPDALSPGSPVTTASVLGVIKDWGTNSHLHLTLDTWLDRTLPTSSSYVCSHTFSPYIGSLSITDVSEYIIATKIPRGETDKVLLTRPGWGRLTATLRSDSAGNTERGPFYITPAAIRQFGFVSYFDLAK